MVLLLVVGLAAVIIVILIAVFLSVRLGRSDDHEEPADRPRERSRGRLNTNDPRRRDERAPRRPPAGAARPVRAQRPSPEAQDGRYRDRDDRRPERDLAVRARDYDRPQRGPSRYDTGPGEQLADPRRPVAAGAPAGAPRPGSRRDYSRRAGTGRDRHEAAPALYDTGPSPRPVDDFASGPQHAADFPSGEFSSRPQPAADFPSGEFPSASLPADAPTAGYRGAGRHFSELPSEPLPAADFASEELPAADFASEEMPAARTRGRAGPPKTDPGRSRTDSRRRPTKGQDAPKGRSRKRDDDDWPSMEWDKVSDEQYWAELSSDKPLATTARTPQPAGEPTPAMARNGRSRSAAAKPRPSVPASQPAPSAAGQARGRDLPARSARIRQREAVAQQREAIAQQREAVAQREAVTERLPIRSRQQPAAAAPPRNGAPTPMRPDATPTPPAGEPSLAMLASLAGGPTGAPDDDPLTSPSFSRPALDSRSYGSARRNGQASDTGSSAYADGPAAAAGYGDNGYASGDYGNGNHANSRPDDRTPVNGAYQVPDHPDPGYAYAQAAAQVPPTGAPQRADWYSAPAPNTPAQNTPAPNTPAQGNPYGSYVEAAPAVSYPSIPPMGYQDQHAGAGLPAYPGDEAGGYAEPTYSPAASLPYPGQTAAGVAGPGVHPSGAGQPPQPAAYPEAGYTNGAYGAEYPGQAPYAEPYGTAGYTPGYPPAGYAADQYGPDDGGYPAGQG